MRMMVIWLVMRIILLVMITEAAREAKAKLGLIMINMVAIKLISWGLVRQACSPLVQLFFGFASDIDQTNINRDIRDGNWLSRIGGHFLKA